MTDALIDQLVAELGRTGMVVGVLPPSPAGKVTAPWIVARKLRYYEHEDMARRLTAPVMLTATSIEQLVRQLEVLPADTTFALEVS